MSYAPAEIIHSLLCEPRRGLPEAAHQWLGEHQGLNVFAFIPDTIAGLRRVMGPDSEMRELWEDNHEMHDAWMMQMTDLLKRLESGSYRQPLAADSFTIFQVGMSSRKVAYQGRRRRGPSRTFCNVGVSGR